MYLTMSGLSRAILSPVVRYIWTVLLGDPASDGDTEKTTAGGAIDSGTTLVGMGWYADSRSWSREKDGKTTR